MNCFCFSLTGLVFFSIAFLRTDFELKSYLILTFPNSDILIIFFFSSTPSPPFSKPKSFMAASVFLLRGELKD